MTGARLIDLIHRGAKIYNLNDEEIVDLWRHLFNSLAECEVQAAYHNTDVTIRERFFMRDIMREDTTLQQEVARIENF